MLARCLNRARIIVVVIGARIRWKMHVSATLVERLQNALIDEYTAVLVDDFVPLNFVARRIYEARVLRTLGTFEFARTSIGQISRRSADIIPAGERASESSVEVLVREVRETLSKARK